MCGKKLLIQYNYVQEVASHVNHYSHDDNINTAVCFVFYPTLLLSIVSKGIALERSDQGRNVTLL